MEVISRSRKWITGFAICALSACLWARPADAQSGINRVNILTFEPSTSPHGILTTDTARTQGHLKWYVGAFLGYAYDPFRAIIEETRPVHSFVHHHVPLDLVVSLGIWKYFELGLHMPGRASPPIRPPAHPRLHPQVSCEL